MNNLIDWYLTEYIALAIIFDAITIGGIYALGSTSLTIVWGTVNFPNIALGAFFALGAYSLLKFMNVFHFSYFESLGLTILFFIPIFLILDRVLFTRYYKAFDPALSLLLIAIGVLIFSEGFYDTYLTYNPQVITTSFSHVTFHIGSYAMAESSIIAIVMEYGIIIILLYFMRFTRYGKVLRAMVQDKETVSLMGADTVALSRLAYVVSSIVAVAGGTIYGLVYSFDPTLETTIAVAITIIALVGGIGSVFGTVVISLMFGAISALAGYFINPVASVYIFYGILFTILFLRPRGLFRR